MEFYNNVNEYLAKTKKLPETIEAIEDPLTVQKIIFFSSVTSIVKLDLQKFQSPQPIMPLVYGELVQVLYSFFIFKIYQTGSNCRG